ncbi:MAG: hypothetical protein Q4D81_07605 [Eubacteriales bacterium]|nr:hypothetical protein [Eubacteriales bacterium]
MKKRFYRLYKGIAILAALILTAGNACGIGLLRTAAAERGEQETSSPDASSAGASSAGAVSPDASSSGASTAGTLSADEAYAAAKDAALSGLQSRMDQEREAVYVYKDFGLTRNHFTQKAKMTGVDESLVLDMDENWQDNPREGSSCIRCEQITREGDWGGWLFLNGYLPRGESVPLLNDGSMDGQGLDLSGADALRFYARGEHGGETVEFFTAGFGYDAKYNFTTVEYPDSARKQSAGEITLTKEWKEYVIPLEDVDLSSIVCGFGYVLNDEMDGNADNVFYLDEIRFTGDIRSAKTAPVLLRSYDTENVYIKNVAFTYDNALAAMAFLSEGRLEEAKEILDAFVYAIENDRALLLAGENAAENSVEAPEVTPEGDSAAGGGSSAMRVRNAYAAGDIQPPPGWESGARLPGWYDPETREWYEDRYQVGSNVGNTSYAALALLQYYRAAGEKKYLETAGALMDWVIETCSDGGRGFTGGFDGWEEGDPPTVYPFTYKSIEHNIDAFSAFSALYEYTGEDKYREAAQSARGFIEDMYDGERGLFMTGTLEDGVTPNSGVVVLDAQVWCAMALGGDFAPYEDALKVVESMKTPEGGYPFCRENKNGGWWAEGTAYTALMYRGLGEEEKYREAMEALESIQLDSGLFPAATNDHLSTGMDLFDGSPWEYSTDPHIAPAAWFIMAVNGFNPYAF